MKTKLMALDALKSFVLHGTCMDSDDLADGRKAISALEADIAKPVDNSEQSAFEDWLTRTNPSGDVESVQRQWIASGDYADLYTTPQEPAAAALLKTLIEAREALQFANDSPKGPICDTIWMMHRPETLFDFLDVAIENSTAAPGGAA